MQFEPRPFQRHILENDARFQVAVIHRRAGKTVAAAEWITQPALDPEPFEGIPPYRGYYAAPLREQALDNVWSYLEDIASQTGAKANRNRAVIEWEHGAQVQCIGTEYGPDRHRGKYADRLVLDETAQIAPSWWRKVARPMLADRNGKALFIGTVSGHDWFWDLYKLGQDPTMPSWSSILLRASESGLIPDQELAELRREVGERDYAIEFECDADIAPLGALFAKEADALNEGRIRPIQHDPDLPVFCGWHFANQAICVAAIQPRRDQFNVLRFERWATTHISEVVRAVLAWPYVYGRHYGGGKLSGYTDSRIGVMNQLGVALQISDTTKILEDNLHDVRSMLPRCVFNVREDGQDDAADLLEAIRTAAVKYYDDTDTYGAQPGASWQVEAVMSLVHFARSHGEHSSDWSKPIDYAA